MRNAAAVAGALLTLVFPFALGAALMTDAAVGWIPSDWSFWTAIALMYASTPAAVFAVVLGIIGAQGYPSRWSVIAMLGGGAETVLLLIGFLIALMA